jgi:hypothetical protein
MAREENGTSDLRRVIETAVMVSLAIAFVIITWWRHEPDAPGALNREMIGVIVAAGLTLIMYSFLYRDNPFFKAAENLYVGIALGYGAIMTWRQSLRPEVFEPLFLSPTAAAFWDELARRGIPILLGILLLTRLSRKHSWLSRYSYGPLVGWGAGMAIVLTIHSSIFKQITAAITPLHEGVTDWSVPADLGLWGSVAHIWSNIAEPLLGTLILLVGTVTVLYYFFFSVEHKRLGKATSNVGIWFLMVSFGATFGFTVMGRLALLIDRLQFLMEEWLKIP